MKRATVPIFVVLAILLSSVWAHANPVPSFEDPLIPCYWLIKTLPFDYTVDLIALCLALLVFGQSQEIAWKLVPLYNLMVVVAGYTSDWGAGRLSQFPAYFPSAKDPIMGGLVADLGYGGFSLSNFTFTNGTAFMTTAAILIFAFNFLIIYLILRLNYIDSLGRLIYAAAIVSVVTCPYIALKGDAKAAWFVPVLLMSLITGVYVLIRRRMEKRRAKKRI